MTKQHTDTRAQVEGGTAECKDAIEQDLIHKASTIHFGDILKIAEAAIKIYASFYDGEYVKCILACLSVCFLSTNLASLLPV